MLGYDYSKILFMTMKNKHGKWKYRWCLCCLQSLKYKKKNKTFENRHYKKTQRHDSKLKFHMKIILGDISNNNLNCNIYLLNALFGVMITKFRRLECAAILNHVHVVDINVLLSFQYSWFTYITGILYESIPFCTLAHLYIGVCVFGCACIYIYIYMREKETYMYLRLKENSLKVRITGIFNYNRVMYTPYATQLLGL